jgi:hypothetical protein
MTSTYADRLVRLGRLEEGLELARTASTGARTSGNTLWLLYSLRTMCIAYIEMGRLSEAASTIQETAIALGTGTPIDRRFLGTLDRLRGLLALKRGDPASALQSANASLAAMAGGGAKLKPLDERASLNLAARAARSSGQPADAEHYARQLLGVAEGVARGPDTSADVGEALLLLAEDEIAQGRAIEAQSLLERAARCLRKRRPCLDSRGPCPVDAQGVLSRRADRVQPGSLLHRRSPGQKKRLPGFQRLSCDPGTYRLDCMPVRHATGLNFSIEGASIAPSITGNMNMRSFLAAVCASLAIALLAALVLDSVFQESATKAFSKSEVRD